MSRLDIHCESMSWWVTKQCESVTTITTTLSTSWLGPHPCQPSITARDLLLTTLLFKQIKYLIAGWKVESTLCCFVHASHLSFLKLGWGKTQGDRFLLELLSLLHTHSNRIMVLAQGVEFMTILIGWIINPKPWRIFTTAVCSVWFDIWQMETKESLNVPNPWNKWKICLWRWPWPINRSQRQPSLKLNPFNMGIVIIVESLLFEWRYHNNPLLPSRKSSHQLKYFRQFIIEYK